MVRLHLYNSKLISVQEGEIMDFIVKRRDYDDDDEFDDDD